MTKDRTTLDIPKNPAERRAWVVYQLRIRGLSLKALGHEVGVTQQAMSAALTGPNFHLEPVIAAALGLTAQQLFPERFTPSGRRIGHTRPPMRKRIPDIAKSQRQCGEVA